ncbi:NAD(P)/FAD-dependent oxidoreductase [Thiohalobacter thiocyanaticus]|uniref:NAD(P)/FAD-dependent oxidoreductase n=1 Tax=Thiohalobacter thiocyanaticus TaxID=585455 RepID=A0A426QDX5_9GAMM|nr:NAD(P)/FAD-dependent oxidoreductase [Thiohalobacter thiocyanaticus]RRQ19960.1 NAD(P)/FAD-dependent oxidoreductase [Thiohalobacter thiocyanaticus]
MNDKHRIVIVGGGAGGLELATRLGRKLGRPGRADITLVDANRTHIWKPLLHEVAAGTFDSYENQLEYLAQGAKNGFHFRLGRMDGLDREKKEIQVAPTCNSEGEEIIPRRTFGYDTLVIAVGSISNDFGIPGVKQHCLFLDTKAQAENFQTRLLESYIHAHAQNRPMELSQLDVVIAGGGATGIELAAQLHKVSRLFRAYGLDNFTPNAIQISIVEAAERILPGLPERLSQAAHGELSRLGIDVITGQRVTEVTATGIRTDSGQFIPAAIRVWAAGIKAPDFLGEIAGLETTRSNQLVVRPTLQTTRDDAIFALGDCAACPWPEKNSLVPPRAQAAHQQASHLYRVLRQRLNNEALSEYHYRDYGSLVSLGRYSTVGNLMGNLTGSVMVEGFIARMVYLSLYKLHQLALFGFYRTAMLSISHLFRAGVHPEIKLH